MVGSENGKGTSVEATDIGGVAAHAASPPTRHHHIDMASQGRTTPTPTRLSEQSNSDTVEIWRAPRDDSSRYQFMSEPSVSEDGSDRILAPHRLPAGPDAFRRIDHEHDLRGGRRPHSSFHNSPGNTSLSSWDTSPGRHAQFHFSSSPRADPLLPRVAVEGLNADRRVRVQPSIPRRRVATGSSVPLQDDTSKEADDGPPSLPNINQVESTDDEREVTDQSIAQPLSINMALSESEEESVEPPESRAEVAENTQTQASFPARRVSRPSNHRRTRSGDAAAASLITGGTEWKGMAKDQLPIPEVIDDDTDDSSSPFRLQSIEQRPDDGSSDKNLQQYQREILTGYQPEKATTRWSETRAMPRERLPWTSSQDAFESTPGSRGPLDSTREIKTEHPEHTSKDASKPESYAVSTHTDVESFPPWASPGTPMARSHDRVLPNPGSFSSQFSADSREYWHDTGKYMASGTGILQSPVLPAGIGFGSHLNESAESASQSKSRRRESEVPLPFVEDVQVSPNSTPPQSGRPPANSQVEEIRIPEHDGSFVPGWESPFANLGKKSVDKALRSSFMPNILSDEDIKKYPTYICPRCKTRQREFFTISDAPKSLAEPSNYLAFYFGVYVIASLFIFGLEEGWKPLDCVYFAVITLTTAGLGDFVPTTSANKIICSIFIYFGVACIGLLLGSYIASMQDDRAYRDAKKKQMESCPNCARIMNIKQVSEQEHTRDGSSAATQSDHRPFAPRDPIHLSLRNVNQSHAAVYLPRHHHSRNDDSQLGQVEGHPSSSSPALATSKTGDHMPPINEQTSAVVESLAQVDSSIVPPPPPPMSVYSSLSPRKNQSILGSPMTREILGRQKHTRHHSFDISNVAWNPKTRKYSEDLPGAITPPELSEAIPLNAPLSAPNQSTQVLLSENGNGTETLRGSAFLYDDFDLERDDSDEFSDDSSSETASTIDEIVDEKVSRIKAAKYVFLTLKQALVNSMVIIAVGCTGFVLTEGFSLVDSWYFTTVLLTTTGYGDITPITNGGKLFATIYILVAGSVLINNMSMISMIPLELRRRRIERAVLTQFGDQLDDAALRELATGPLIQRLSLSANRADGLDECTREMFSLAMLVRLGKVTEDDIRETFAVFRRLDVNDEGVLNSKSIIAGMIQKHRSSMRNSESIRQQRAGGALLPSTVSRQSEKSGQALPYWLMPPIPFSAHNTYNDSSSGVGQAHETLTRQMQIPSVATPDETTSLLPQSKRTN